MDVHDKLDELSALLENARSMPMSASCVVNRSQVIEVVDDIRSLLPDELRYADQLLADSERVVAEGRTEAERLVSRARDESDRLVSENEVYLAAVAEAEATRREAFDEATRMRTEIDDYVDAKLANFEIALQKTMNAVAKGREKIRARTPADEGEDDDDQYTGPIQTGYIDR
jgi:cell division septum initiation protein DivIVA